VAYVHLKYLNPFPANLDIIISKYKTILVPEMNMGQLKSILQSKFPVRVLGLNKVQGIPFKTSEIKSKIEELLSEKEAAI